MRTSINILKQPFILKLQCIKMLKRHAIVNQPGKWRPMPLHTTYSITFAIYCNAAFLQHGIFYK